MLSKILDLIWYYEKDKRNGVPYWLDPTLIGAAVGLVSSLVAQHFGLQINSDLQLKIIGVTTGIGALASPHTGFVAKPDEAKAVAQQVQQHNLTDLS